MGLVGEHKLTSGVEYIIIKTNAPFLGGDGKGGLFMIKAVVFDLDGTLLDTIPDIAFALNRALDQCGLPTHPEEECKGFVGGGIREAVTKAAPPDSCPEVIDRVLEAYHAYYPTHCMVKTALYPGVPELLEGLVARGVVLGILSNKTEKPTKRIAEAFFPQIPFHCVFGRIDGCPLKPDPAAVNRVLEALGLPPEEIAYVGDSGTDMAFAKAAGMLPAAAPWGYRSRENLIENGAVLVPEDPQELLELLLERINNT